MSFKEAQADIEAAAKKHGIGTYVFVIKDPDGDLEAFGFDGPLSWCYGACAMMQRLIATHRDEIENEP